MKQTFYIIESAKKDTADNLFDTELVRILWNSIGTAPGDISLPMYIEQHAEEIREKCLSIFFELGELKIAGKSLCEHLEIRPGFSYWWMTTLSYRPNAFSAKSINDIIKCIALYDLLLKKKPKRVILYSNKKELARTIEDISKKLHIDFYWKKIRPYYPIFFEKGFSLRKILKSSVPLWFQGVIAFFLIMKNFLFIKSTSLHQNKNSISFFSYLFNIDTNALNKKRFYTFYWTRLHQFIDNSSIHCNWYHRYVSSTLTSNARNADSLLKTLNNIDSPSNHFLLESFLDLKICFKIISDFIAIFNKGLSILKKLHKKISIEFSFDVWPLLRNEFHNSLFGPWLMERVFELNILERIIFSMPPQKRGFYLMENQPWELALVYFWKHSGKHGEIVGVPHSTVRFWDLRYCQDKRIFSQKGPCQRPRPHIVAVNGPIARSRYEESGCPASEIFEVEALRFLYLNHIKRKSRGKEDESKKKKLLVLTDYSKELTSTQIEWITSEFGSLAKKFHITVKPHPHCPVSRKRLPDEIIISNEPLKNIISEFDMAFTSNNTSAAVDAYCAGLTVICIWDPAMPNFSPLRGCDGVYFVTSKCQFIELLLYLYTKKLDIDELCQNIFCLSWNLERWKTLVCPEESQNEKILPT